MGKLTLFNSLTRELEAFTPVRAGQALVYTCGPTVYHYAHLGNLRAYIFADILGRALAGQGLNLTHVINITDVGHLTDDADDGEDKLEKASKRDSRSIWDIAAHYTETFKTHFAAVGNREPAKWTTATSYITQMIDFISAIADKHGYELESGLYFDTSTVEDYGKLSGAAHDHGHGRIENVAGKRHPADFALWRRTPAGETRQMEWDSPWGRGAPGWHIECSAMSHEALGFPFDIHTGGIDHREVHHANEIAQNQAFGRTGSLDCTHNSGASMWMHNNFLVDRKGKMSKSAGEFLTVDAILARGYHPLTYRMMALQAHYRSELEFSWESLEAATVRYRRMLAKVQTLTAAASEQPEAPESERKVDALLMRFHAAIETDLNTPEALIAMEELLALKKTSPVAIRKALLEMDQILGLQLDGNVGKLSIRPASNNVSEEEIEKIMAERLKAREAKDFETSDRLRDRLGDLGVEVMDMPGNVASWHWKTIPEA